MCELSIIIPVYYGEKTIAKLVDALHKTLRPRLPSFEIVLVNDGSRDKSDEICERLVDRYPKTVVYADLAKNFTEHNAVMAGLTTCCGNYAVLIDDDFQNPPSEILKLYTKIKKTDADVVYSYYKEKKHSWFRNLGSRFNDKVANIVLEKPSDLYLSSFKILYRRIIDEITRYKGPYPYIDGLILRSTRHIETQLVEHAPRKDGESNYTFKKLMFLWSNMFVNFSLKPLRWSLYLGFLFAALSFIFGIAFIIEKIKNPSLPLGWASNTIALFLFSGIQLLILGMIGEFVGRLYLTNNETPQFVIRKIIRGTNHEKK